MIKRNIWINNIISCVKEIASKEYQEKAWIKNEIHWPCSMEELACSLFDDCFIDEFINEKADEFKLSRKQKSTLTTLVNTFDKYLDKPEIYFPRRPPKIDESKVLADPEWRQIQKKAQKVLKAFGKIKYEPEDKEWCLGYILHSISRYADIEDQKRMWIEKSEIFFSTPRDMHDALFEHCEFDYFMDEYAEKFGLTKQQIEALNRFRCQLKATPFATVDYENLLHHPEWQKLQFLAKEVGEAFSINNVKR